MKRRITWISMLLMAVLATSVWADEDKKAAKADKQKKRPAKAAQILKRLLGDWEYTSGKRQGEDVAEERLGGVVTITKETFTLPAGPDSKFVMAFKIDTTQKPAHIDLKIKSGPVPEGATVGIIKLEKNQITLCYDPTGANRPKEFKSTKDNGTFLFTLKRKAKAGKKKAAKKPSDKKPSDKKPSSDEAKK